MTNNDVQKTTQKTTDRATRNSCQKQGVNPMAPENKV